MTDDPTAPFESDDAETVRRAAAIRARARSLVELWARRAALELARHRGARLSQLREHWDRSGFFVFAEPLGNAWIGVDLSPERPLTAGLEVPLAPLRGSLDRLLAAGMVQAGEGLRAHWPLAVGLPLTELAPQSFPGLWSLWELCHELAVDPDPPPR